MAGSLSNLLILAVFMLTTSHVKGYAYFQERIPNGDKVPHPCKPNYLWHGVGHLNVAGGGERNPFGIDFAKNGFKWDACICERDSDGDGIINGVELGDPLCEWKVGDTPTVTNYADITHPGVCEPLDDPECMRRNNWDFCAYREFSCDAFDDPSVKNITLRFPPTQVPPEETIYMCMAFALPDDKDYHIIGHLANIDNENVMHHILGYACDDSVGAQLLEQFATPRPCSESKEMISSQCRYNIGGWTVGEAGNCIDSEEYGYRIGANGVRVAVLEYHWNNPEKRSDYIDSTGLTYMYTDKLRPNDAQLFTVGPLFLEIPAGRKTHTEVGYCSSECTETAINNKMYIADILPHMHYLGRGMIVEHWRNGELLRELVNDQNYRYDSPNPIIFKPHVEVLPGDGFKVTCNFNSMSSSEMTFFGEGTFDEMCFALMTVYPVNTAFDGCWSIGESTLCGADNFLSGACNYTEFFTNFYRLHYLRVSTNCDPEGKTCKAGCEAAIEEIKDASPQCFSGDQYKTAKWIMMTVDELTPIYRMVSSCDEYPQEASSEASSSTDSVGGALCPTTAGAQRKLPAMVTLLAPFIFGLSKLL